MWFKQVFLMYFEISVVVGICLIDYYSMLVCVIQWNQCLIDDMQLIGVFVQD